MSFHSSYIAVFIFRACLAGFLFRNVRLEDESLILGKPITQLWNCDSLEIDLFIICGTFTSVQVIEGNKSADLSVLKDRSNFCLSLTDNPWNVFSLLTRRGSWLNCNLFLASLANRFLSLFKLNKFSCTFRFSVLRSMLLCIRSFSISRSATARDLIHSWKIVRALSWTDWWLIDLDTCHSIFLPN